MTATTSHTRVGSTPSVIVGAGLVLGYAVVVAAANRAFTVPPIAVTHALLVPVGALFAGVALTARDLVHDVFGPRGVAAAIVLGTALSWLLAGPGIAMASALAFVASEVVDAVIYARLRPRSRLLAVAGSNLGGLVIDSALFIPLAYGSLTAVPGQLVGKVAATALTVLALAAATAYRGRVRA